MSYNGGSGIPVNFRYLRRLKEILMAHSYHSVGNISTDSLFTPSTIYKYRNELPSNTLIKLFLIGSNADDFEVNQIFDSEEKLAFQELGLIEQVGDNGWRGLIKLLPYEKLIFFCDFSNRPDNQIHKVYEPGPDSKNLAKAGLRLPFKAALDLCTGSGIQAVMSAKHCNYVTAVDINPRAVHFGAMSVTINCLDNVEIRLADLYDGIEGKRFDLITANPPFVINAKPTEQFRDGGERGDNIFRRILQGLPAHLITGGYAQIVTFLHEFEDYSQIEQVRAFAETHQFETIVFTFTSFDKFQLAIAQNRNKISNKSKDSKASFLDDLAHLGRLKLISCSLAVITFRNTGKYRLKKLCILESRKFYEAELQKHLNEFYDL